jgi:hypothetical protein
MGRPEFGYAYARSGYSMGEDNQELNRGGLGVRSPLDR